MLDPPVGSSLRFPLPADCGGGDSSGDDVQRVNEFKIGFGASSSSQRPVFVNPMFDSKEDALEGVDKLLEEVDRLGF